MSEPRPSERNAEPSPGGGGDRSARARARAVRHVILDLDGTVYLGGRLYPWSGPFLELLRSRGISWTFVTNNNSRSTTQTIDRLRRLGLDAAESCVYTSTLATIEHLRERAPKPRRLFVLGTPALREEFASAGFVEAGEGADDPPEAVVVGFDTTLSYPRLARAAYWIERGLPYVATHPDRICPTDEAIVLPDCAAICACLETATGRAPDATLGKPDRRMVLGPLRGRGVPVRDVAVVGDRLYTDMRMARESGALGVLVLSGETTRGEAEAAPGAYDIVVESLAELADLLR